jgi:hypothetical protein
MSTAPTDGLVEEIAQVVYEKVRTPLLFKDADATRRGAYLWIASAVLSHPAIQEALKAKAEEKALVGALEGMMRVIQHPDPWNKAHEAELRACVQGARAALSTKEGVDPGSNDWTAANIAEIDRMIAACSDEDAVTKMSLIAAREKFADAASVSTLDQPAPTPNGGTPIWDLVITDMRERDLVGRTRYGTPLQAHNGRDGLADAYAEALDLAVYLKKEIVERDTASLSTSPAALRAQEGE